jgi:hypothetical protein
MRNIISSAVAGIVISAALLSFSPKPGGEGFEISQGGKILIQKFGNNLEEGKSLQLQISSTEPLIVKYYHCGRVGNNRIITVKDDQNKLLKEFHYADLKTPAPSMTVPLKDILTMKKGSSVSLKLYYSSTELPKGRQLASIISGNSSLAKR